MKRPGCKHTHTLSVLVHPAFSDTVTPDWVGSVTHKTTFVDTGAGFVGRIAALARCGLLLQTE